MKLTHTGDDRLTTLLIGVHLERWILFSQLSKTVVKFGNVSLALRLHGHLNHRIREGHRLEHNRMVLIAERITRADILETYTCADITGIDAFHRNFLLGVHLEQTAHTLFLARTGIVNIRTCGHLTGVDAEEHQAAHERVSGNLEGKSRQRLILIRLAIFLFTGIRIGTLHILGIKRRGKESTSIVEQRLHTLVLVR